MKTMRIPLLIAWGVAIIGIIFGSFFDLNISTAIASPTNYFGLAISALGPTIGFAGVAVMGGGFIAFIVKGKYHIGLKILFGVLAACCYGVAVYYPAGEWFGINGFYGAAPEWLGYIIVIIPEAAAMFGGYLLFKDWQNNNMWIVFCIVIVLLLIVLLAIIPTLKDIIHRPRYRFISTHDEVKFHNWWEPFKEYKDYIAAHPDEPHDNFKSYPSGHTAETTILIVAATFYPMANAKFKKWQMPCFYVACGLTLLVALARILAAAHFLSDVSTGAFVTLTFVIIANEVVMRIKALQLKEEAPKEEQVHE